MLSAPEAAIQRTGFDDGLGPPSGCSRTAQPHCIVPSPRDRTRLAGLRLTLTVTPRGAGLMHKRIEDMISTVIACASREDGQTMVEYGLLAVAIAMAVLVAVQLLG